MNINRSYLLGTAAACATVATATAAMGGGLAVREQSTSAQGASFAGASAGGDLSSSFWNPAALGIAGKGLTSESHYSAILPDVEVRSNSRTTLPGSLAPAGTVVTGNSMTMDRMAIVGSSYYAYRWSDAVVLGMAINSPFGIANETSNDTWSGQYHFRSAKLLTMTATGMASLQLAPGLNVGVGLQAQYAKLRFKANPSSGLAPTQANSVLDGDDIGFGYTAGLLWQPARGTNIGLGYRSRVNHTVEGSAFMASGTLITGVVGTQPFSPIAMEAKLTTPDIANLSIRQDVAPNARLLGSVEWTNWSVVDRVDFIATAGGGIPVAPTAVGTLLNRFDFYWKDGWMFSLGGEYDWSKQLTLRSGVAYEISPIQNADQRKANITDANRIWLSLGANYKWSQSMSFDVAYSHVFIDDGAILQNTTTPGSGTTPVRVLDATAKQSADIISVSMKTKW